MRSSLDRTIEDHPSNATPADEWRASGWGGKTTPGLLKAPIAALSRHRGLIHAITVRDIRSRYVGSVLGVLWLLLPPIAMVLIYTVIFTKIMQARLPGAANQYAYSIYLCAGLVAWGLFVELVQRGKGVFLENANLIKKSNFPRSILFVPVVVVALFNSLVLFGLVLLFMLLSSYPLSWAVADMLPALAVAVYLGMGLAMMLAILNVFFRDTGQIVDVVFQGLFWATPIVYPISILSDWAREVLSWNPVFPIVRVAQGALLGEPVGLSTLVYPFVCATVVLLVAILLYRRSHADLLDQI